MPPPARPARRRAPVVGRSSTELIHGMRLLGGGGRIILVASPGSGLGLALDMARGIGPDVPFCLMGGQEIAPTAGGGLAEACRRAIGVQFSLNSEVYQGVVEEIAIKNFREGARVFVVSIVVRLKAAGGSLRLKLHGGLCRSFVAARVGVGVVVRIEPGRSSVVSAGRGGAGPDGSVNPPQGEVYGRRSSVQRVTLHDLDSANLGPAKGMAERLRAEVDLLVLRHVQGGRAVLLPGVVLIDDAQGLGEGVLALLARFLERGLTPTFVLATSRTSLGPAHGLPPWVDHWGFGGRCIAGPKHRGGQEGLCEAIAVWARGAGVLATGNCLVEGGDLGGLRFASLLIGASGVLSRHLGMASASAPVMAAAAFFFLDRRASGRLLGSGSGPLPVHRVF